MALIASTVYGLARYLKQSAAQWHRKAVVGRSVMPVRSPCTLLCDAGTAFQTDKMPRAAGLTIS
jgi:hypothetical protein